MICPSCGTANASKNRFCQSCGTPLTASGEAAPTPTRPAGTPSVSRSGPGEGAFVSPQKLGKSRIDRLGTRIDGWADLIDDAGDQVNALFQSVRQRLSQRQMPWVGHHDRMLTTGGLMGEKRQYHLVFHQVGSIVAVYIGAFGKDLYVAWDLFVSQVWKWLTFLIVFGLAAIAALLAQAVPFFRRWSGIAFSRVMKGFWESRFSLPSWLIYTAVIAFGLFVLVGVGGMILKRSFWTFFREEYNHFRADDVTAMTLGVHRSLMEGLDSIGVDRALIRPKEQFRAGRRERII